MENFENDQPILDLLLKDDIETIDKFLPKPIRGADGKKGAKLRVDARIRPWIKKDEPETF